jgi:pimeloyl-ACP methyl ester carboxylesterase
VTIESFQIQIESAQLDDLQRRLELTRLADDFGNDDWAYGTERNYLQSLLTYWRDEYNWRDHEAAMNRFEHFRCQIDGITLHFLRRPGRGPAPKPLLLLHGWPWTFWDYQKVIEPLSDPAAFGGDDADAFDVIVPSLPGYGFSTPLTQPGMNFSRAADLFVSLMAALGHDRFAVHGHDWGAIIAAQLGHKCADRLIGTHFTTMLPLDLFTGGTVAPEFFGPEDQHIIERNTHFFTEGNGYFQIQATRPQTLAYGLNDSPIGLCAWIVDKRRAWSDCKGDVESRFSKDDLITTTMLYWLTGSFGTSARFYYEAMHRPWTPSHDRTPVVEAPCGVAVFPEEILLQPRAWMRHYYNLQHVTDMPSGGHFAAMEEPVALTEDIRLFFRGRS